jgi:predicted NAD/FAD-binding protein
MPLDLIPALRPLNIAIVGSGIAGMSAAWLLSRNHRVTVFERNSRIGGHSNTVMVRGPDGRIPVDTGFIVYNDANYPNLVALFRHLGVPTKPSNMSFAASIDDGDFEYASGPRGLFAQGRNALRPRFWRMVADLVRFYRQAPAIEHDAQAAQLTLGEYLDRHGYSRAFIDDHLLPMAAAVWSAPVETMRDHPALAFIRFNMRHGLLRLSGRPQWRTVDGGAQAYVARLTAGYADRIHVGAGVRRVWRLPGVVIIEDSDGRPASYDHVVIAAHADEALAMLADPSGDETAILGAFPYQRNRAVLHSDTRLMPKRRHVWSSWNYLSQRDDDGDDGGRARVCVSYWMNSLQGLDARVPLFVTLNGHREPAPELTHATVDYDHPSYTLAALTAQGRLQNLQGQRNTWYCGSYFGAGFHEDALDSGLSVAERLGGMRRPWAVDDGWRWQGAGGALPGTVEAGG